MKTKLPISFFCVCLALWGYAQNTISLTPASVITEQVNLHRPSLGGAIPADLKDRLGASHVAGEYCLTSEPFLIEGAQKILDFGSNVIKVWFETPATKYPWNSDWSALPANYTLVDLAKHPYYDALFNLPFTTFVLEITNPNGLPNVNASGSPNFSGYTQQFQDLANYLYSKFSGRNVTFILENWEGDWLFRNDNYGTSPWTPGMLADLPRRIDNYTRWFTAEQTGVENARKNFAAGDPCRILHAVEVNRVLTLLDGSGTPTLTDRVLPNIKPDLVSWSCYDGMNSPTDMWHGIELIQHYMQTSGYLPNPKTVMIGEIGLAENSRTQSQIVNFWDWAMGVFFAFSNDIPWILHWEVYCNELTPSAPLTPPTANGYSANDVKGFWLYRPDGSLSYSGQYLRNLLIKTTQPSDPYLFDDFEPGSINSAGICTDQVNTSPPPAGWNCNGNTSALPIVVANPDPSGINTSANVMLSSRTSANAGTNWAGPKIKDAEWGTAFTDTWGGVISGYNYMHIMMYANKVIQPGVNTGGGDVPAMNASDIVPYTWVDVVFDLSAYPVFDNMIAIFIDRTNPWTSDSKVYMDNMILTNDPTPRTISTGINDVTGGDATIFVANGTLYISGSNDAVAIYNLLGQKVYQKPSAQNLSVKLPKGLYIVKTGTVIKKIVLQ